MNQEKDDKKRIYWDEGEIAKVAEEAFRLYLQDIENLWTLIEEAQQVLPENRRRTIMGRATVNAALREKFEEIRRTFLEECQEPPIEIEVETVVQKEVPRAELLASISAEEILTLLARKFAPFLESLGKATATAEKALPPVVIPVAQKPVYFEQPIETEPKKRHPKVLILEFLADQEEAIRKKAAGFQLELIFGGKGRREQVPRTCNWCVILRKVSHSTSKRMKNQIEGGHTFVVNGIDSAMKALADINSKIHGMQST